MTLINAPLGGNSPDISRIRLILAEDIVRIGQVDTYTTTDQPIVLKANADIVTIWVAAKYSEAQELTDAGQPWKWNLEFEIPKDRPELAELLDLLSNKNLVAIYADSNGLCRLVGNKSYPCQLLLGFATSPNNTALSISGVGLERALYLPSHLMDAALLKVGAFSNDFSFAFN